MEAGLRHGIQNKGKGLFISVYLALFCLFLRIPSWFLPRIVRYEPNIVRKSMNSRGRKIKVTILRKKVKIVRRKPRDLREIITIAS